MAEEHKIEASSHIYLEWNQEDNRWEIATIMTPDLGCPEGATPNDSECECEGGHESPEHVHQLECAWERGLPSLLELHTMIGEFLVLEGVL